MTRKLYYENVYLKEFTADILETIEKDGKHHLILDQTAFYPEGGGQPHDIGHIGESQVEYVYEDEGNILHVVDLLPQKLEHLKCKIDWDRRFDHMQQHLGQHILSAAFYKLFDAETVGFHLGTEFVTIDVTIENISPSQVQRAEYFSNQILFNNLHVKQLYPDEDTLNKLPLRKQPKVEKNIRIIEVDQVDFSPCGGTHPFQTGEVGLIKIRKWEKIRGTTRIEFVCGNRALYDYYWKNQQINALSSLLSAKDVDTQKTVERIYEENNEVKRELKTLKGKLLDFEAQSLYDHAKNFEGTKLLVQVVENYDIGELRVLASKVTSYPNIVLLFGTKANNKAQLIFSRSKELDVPMNQIFHEVSSMINGKGGGNAQTAQGGGDDISNLETALQAAEMIITKRYLKG